MDASKTTVIHPAVRKLLGKTVRAADVNSLLAEPPPSSSVPTARRHTRRHIVTASQSNKV